MDRVCLLCFSMRWGFRQVPREEHDGVFRKGIRLRSQIEDLKYEICCVKCRAVMVIRLTTVGLATFHWKFCLSCQVHIFNSKILVIQGVKGL